MRGVFFASILAWFLTNSGGVDSPGFEAHSPSINGKSALFDDLATGRGGIFQIDLGHVGRGVMLITGSLYESHPVYSPDGGEFAFTRQTNNSQHVWLSSFDGLRLRQLTTGHATDEIVTFSSNGRSLFILRKTWPLLGHRPITRLMEVDLATLEVSIVTNSRDASGISANAQWVLFCKYVEGQNDELFGVMRRDGSERRVLTSGWGAKLSPNASLIAFLRSKPDYTSELCILELETGTEHLPQTPKGYKTAPEFSLDGKFITFRIPASERDGPGGLFVLDVTTFKCQRMGEISGGALRSPME
jgi:Tol biopolymer transport system component